MESGAGAEGLPKPRAQQRERGEEDNQPLGARRCVMQPSQIQIPLLSAFGKLPEDVASARLARQLLSNQTLSLQTDSLDPVITQSANRVKATSVSHFLQYPMTPLHLLESGLPGKFCFSVGNLSTPKCTQPT